MSSVSESGPHASPKVTLTARKFSRSPPKPCTNFSIYTLLNLFRLSSSSISCFCLPSAVADLTGGRKLGIAIGGGVADRVGYRCRGRAASAAPDTAAFGLDGPASESESESESEDDEEDEEDASDESAFISWSCTGAGLTRASSSELEPEEESEDDSEACLRLRLRARRLVVFTTGGADMVVC
jgi:hypothetical protein